MADMPAPIARLYDECYGCGCLGCHASKALTAVRAALDECDRIDGPHGDWLVRHGREPEAETARRTAANIRNAITTALEGKQ